MTITAAMTAPALAQNRTTADQGGGTVRRDGGSLRAGDVVRLDPHVRFHSDMLLRDQSEVVDLDLFDPIRRCPARSIDAAAFVTKQLEARRVRLFLSLHG